MDVVVISRRLEVPDELRESAGRKTERLSRYLGMERAEVTFSNSPVGRLGDPVTCEIVLEGHGHVVRAVGTGGHPATALHAALDKDALQLTHLKRKLVGRSRPRHGETKQPAPDAGIAEPWAPRGSGGPDGSGRPEGSDWPEGSEAGDDFEGITEL